MSYDRSNEDYDARATSDAAAGFGPRQQVMSSLPHQIIALRRAEYLLRVVGKFMEANPNAANCTAIWDRSVCDGGCLADDALAAAEDLCDTFNIKPVFLEHEEDQNA